MKDFREFVLDTFSELAEQFERKNRQYGDIDAIGDFRTGALTEYKNDSPNSMYKVAKHYALKHIAHVYGHDAFGDKVDESLKDIAIYSVIELYFHELAKQERAIEINGNHTKSI